MIGVYINLVMLVLWIVLTFALATTAFIPAMCISVAGALVCLAIVALS